LTISRKYPFFFTVDILWRKYVAYAASRPRIRDIYRISGETGLLWQSLFNPCKVVNINHIWHNKKKFEPPEIVNGGNT